MGELKEDKETFSASSAKLFSQETPSRMMGAQAINTKELKEEPEKNPKEIKKEIHTYLQFFIQEDFEMIDMIGTHIRFKNPPDLEKLKTISNLINKDLNLKNEDGCMVNRFAWYLQKYKDGFLYQEKLSKCSTYLTPP